MQGIGFQGWGFFHYDVGVKGGRYILQTLITLIKKICMRRQAGSGTDPGEGAALAGAMLTALADRAALTLATTHHASLKELAVGISPRPQQVPMKVVAILQA